VAPKTVQPSKKSLEDVSQTVLALLKHTNEQPTHEITGAKDVALLEALVSFHPSKHTLCSEQITFEASTNDG